MWTYVMATSRGDRGNSIISRRQPDIDLSRFHPTYRSTVGNTFCVKQSTLLFGASYAHVNGPSKPSNIKNRYIQLKSQKVEELHHQHNIVDTDDYSADSGRSTNDSYAMKDDTSLFLPRSPNCPIMSDNAMLIAPNQLLDRFKSRTTALTSAFEEQHCVIGLHPSSKEANTPIKISSEANFLAKNDHTYEQILNSSKNHFNYSVSSHLIRQLQYSPNNVNVDCDNGLRRNDYNAKNKEVLNDDSNYLNKSQENINIIPLDQMKRRSTLHRTINTLRQNLTKRSRTKPPDWFIERFNTNETQSDEFIKERVLSPTNKIKNNIKETSVHTIATRAGLDHEIHGPNLLCNYLSVNTSLQSHYRWLALVSLTVLYNIIFVVGRAVFWEINKKASLVWYTLDYFCDLIYVADIFVHMHEGYLDQGLLVRDAYKLRRHYFTTKSWCFDFLSIVPTDLLYIWWSPSLCGANFLPCAVIVRLNRLLRLPRMWEWFERTETATGYPNAFRICKVVLAILILIHWNACMYFAISFNLGFGTDNWVYNLNGSRNNTLQRQYIYSFYWSTLTLTTIGETPTPENDAEYLFVVLDFLAGVLIFATIVDGLELLFFKPGNIGSMISNMNVARVEFQNRMDGVKQYMTFRKVGHELEARVIRWFAYTWSQSGALDEERVLAALPDKLKTEIAIQVHMDTLKQVRIFHDCEPGLLEALVLKLKLQVFSPGDYICRKGDVGKEMYIVKRGKLSVVADDGVTVLATLGAGSVFGEVSVLEIAGNRTGNRRTANVRSLGYSDLFCLSKRDLWETLADYPDARATLTERGCQLLRKDGLLDEQMFADSQVIHDSIEGGIEKLELSVENLNGRLARLMTEYTASQAKLKQRLIKLELNYYLAPASLTKEHMQSKRSGRFYSLQMKRRSKPRANNFVTFSKGCKQYTL